MIDRQGRKIIMECDSCPETYTSAEGAEFSAFLAEAKTEGWSVAKIADEWLHGCPRCGRPT